MSLRLQALPALNGSVQEAGQFGLQLAEEGKIFRAKEGPLHDLRDQTDDEHPAMHYPDCGSIDDRDSIINRNP